MVKEDLPLIGYHNLSSRTSKYFKRDGAEVEKGVVLTEPYLEKHQKEIYKICNHFIAYPDLYLDRIKPMESNFVLYFYQRIFLRAALRFKTFYCTACRAFSKTFLSLLAIYLECVFIPNTKRFICAPGKGQSAKIAKDKIFEIWEHFPLLKNEIKGEGNFGKDYIELRFKNGSRFDVVGALDSERGGRRHGGLVDEVRDHDGEQLNSIVLPLMNVSRKMANGEVNFKEPNQQQLFMTSAGTKSTFAYDKQIEVLEMSIIDPQNYYVFGCDYRLPVKHGLLDARYINELKMSPTYDEETFAREYMSVWTGGNDDAWFNYDKLQRYRRLKNPEKHAINRGEQNSFYLLSTDVGRLNDQTVVSVFKVNVRDGRYFASLVNIIVLGTTPETKPFSIQARDLKMLIRDYSPREVVIDTNGIGVGLADEMIKTQVTPNGEVLPAYGFMNDKDYKKIQPKDAPMILYGIKANASLNSSIHANCYSRLHNGKVRLLISEQDAKVALMATKKGQKMKPEDRVRRLLPHQMTTKLLEEMANLRLKRTGNNLEITLERINPRFPKDKYSSFSYGLWRIKELEEENTKRLKRYNASNNRALVFFTKGC